MGSLVSLICRFCGGALCNTAISSASRRKWDRCVDNIENAHMYNLTILKLNMRRWNCVLNLEGGTSVYNCQQLSVSYHEVIPSRDASVESCHGQ